MPEIAHPVSNEAIADLIGCSRAVCEEFDHGAELAVLAEWPDGSSAVARVPTTGREPHRSGEWTSCFPVKADYETAAARLRR